MRNHPLIDTILTVQGNPRACLYTEPLWTIPFNLYMPFVSVYMAALLLTDSQIGIVASVNMLFMAVFALFSGALTDKFGRKQTTFIFDLLSWSVPCLLWALSQNFTWFVIAAAFNGIMQVTANSWTCLLVEDAQKNKLVRIFALLHVIGQLSVIFAPLAAILVNRFTVVPVMRALYLFSFTSMTVKFIVLYRYSEETQTGTVRMKETAHMPVLKILAGYSHVVRRIAASAEMKLALAINALLHTISMINSNFFGLYITGPLSIPEHILAYYPILRSAIIILFMFSVQPRVSSLGFRHPMLAGVILYVCSYAALLFSPAGNIFIPFIYIFIEACAFSLITPSKDSLVVLLIDPDERARISSIMTALVLCCSMPFGYIAGLLSDADRRLPFVLNIVLFALVFAILCVNGRLLKKVQDESGKM